MFPVFPYIYRGMTTAIYNPSTIGRSVLEHPIGGGFTLPLYPPPYGPPSGNLAKSVVKHTCLTKICVLDGRGKGPYGRLMNL